MEISTLMDVFTKNPPIKEIHSDVINHFETLLISSIIVSVCGEQATFSVNPPEVYPL